MNYVNAYVNAVNYARRPPESDKVHADLAIGKGVNYQLQGTKLAADLARIRHVFGIGDPEMRKLADAALAGNRDAFVSVRDRLLRHSHPDYKVSLIGPSMERSHGLKPDEYRQEASRLAHEYNWDRVGKSLDLDDVVAEYVWKVAGSRLKERNEVYRAAHNLFGHGSADRRPDSETARTAFWDGLRKHMRDRAVGADTSFGFSRHDVTDDKLTKSIRRLAEREYNLSSTTSGDVSVSRLIGEGRKLQRGEGRIRDVTVTASPAGNPATRLPMRGPGRPKYDETGKLLTPPRFLPSGLPTRAQQFRRQRPAKYGVIQDKIAAAVLLPKRLVDAAVDATAGRAARAIGLDPRQHPELNTERERTVINPQTGDEPGVNLWTGNERRRGTPLKAEIVPEHHWSDGLVHNGVYPGTNIVAPSANAAYRERLAVHRALEQRTSSTVPASVVSDHIAEIKRLAETPTGQALIGDRLKHYRWIAETLPATGGKFLRGTGDLESRPNSPVDDRLTALVGPLVRLANAHLVARNKAAPLAGDRGPGGFEVSGDDPSHEFNVDAHPDHFDLPVVEGLHSPDVDEIEAYANPPTSDEMIAAAKDRERGLRRVAAASKKTTQKDITSLLKTALAKLKEKMASDEPPLPLAEAPASKKAKTRLPLSKIRQAIADHKADRLPEKSIVAKVAAEFDLTPEAAAKQVSNFLRLRRKPEGTPSKKPEPPAKKGTIKRKKYSRSETTESTTWKAPTGGWVDRDGVYYAGGKFTSSPSTTSPKQSKKYKKKSLLKAMRLIRALSTAGAVV